MAYPSSYYTPGGNFFSSSANGTTTGMGGSVAAAPVRTPMSTAGMTSDQLWNGIGVTNTNGLTQQGQYTGPESIDAILARTNAINSMAGSGMNYGQALDAYNTQNGIDPNVNTFASQMLQAGINGSNSPFQTYAQENPVAGPRIQPLGSHRAPGSRNDSGGDTGGMSGMGGEYGLSTNPYEGAQADALAAQQQQFLDQNFNNIRSTSVGVGGLGGSRQGVAQGTAIGQAATGLAGATANLYGNNWNQEQGRALSQYGMDQGFYTAQRGLDQAGMALGANLYGQGTMGQWGPINQAGAAFSPYTGFGNTTTNISGGGGAMGALGGALGGAQLAKQWWGS